MFSVEAFFAFWVHANQLFHAPSFLASLKLAPTDAKFPPSAVLHSICAIGSLYVANIAPVPQPPSDYTPCTSCRAAFLIYTVIH